MGVLDSREKRKLSNGQLWKIWKETAFIKLCSFFIDLLEFELGKLCPGVGIFASFFDPGAGILTEKISGPGVSLGGGGGGGNRSN